MEQNKNKESEWFGFEQIDPKEKTEKVLGVFRSVADKYDIMNDIMSFGAHRVWKNIRTNWDSFQRNRSRNDSVYPHHSQDRYSRTKYPLLHRSFPKL